MIFWLSIECSSTVLKVSTIQLLRGVHFIKRDVTERHGKFGWHQASMSVVQRRLPNSSSDHLEVIPDIIGHSSEYSWTTESVLLTSVFEQKCSALL